MHKLRLVFGVLALTTFCGYASAAMLATAPVSSVSNVQVVAPGDSGLKVLNLQKALSAIADHGIISALDPPSHPTLQELQALETALRTEKAGQEYGRATQQLVQYFQVQQGLGDGLGGSVDSVTAQRLNDVLNSLGVHISSGPGISCNMVSIDQKSHSVKISIFDMQGAVVATNSYVLSAFEVVELRDPGNSGSWCRFAVNDPDGVRAAALIGTTGRANSFAIVAQ
jgi:hypothetical protein